MGTLTIEDSLGRLQFEANAKLAEIKALEAQRQASALRLDDAVKKEAEAQVALRKVTEAFDEASKALTQAKRTAAKILADAAAERDRILQQANERAEGFLRGIQSAIAAAASVIKENKQGA
jgi:hypothetical protein